MIDIKKIDNISTFNEMLKKVPLRFPVADIHRKTGYSKGSISEILKGKRPPTDEFLKKFAESFKIDIPETNYNEQIETLEIVEEQSESYDLKNGNKKPSSQKENDNDPGVVSRLVKMLDDANQEIKLLRQELERKKNN